MIEALLTFFEQYTSLTEDEKNYINAHIPIKEIQKDELLLAEGEVSKAFYFIIKIEKIKNEHVSVYFENMFVSSYESFTKQTPSKHYLQAIENTSVAVISHEVAYKLLELFPRFEFLARVMMEEELIVYQEIIASFITLNAEKRYLKLVQTNPELLQRIPQYQLATFLGVTPETLSRIRKRIISKDIS